MPNISCKKSEFMAFVISQCNNKEYCFDRFKKGDKLDIKQYTCYKISSFAHHF
jgi:hypothetical protein